MPFRCDSECCENPGGRGQAVCWTVDRMCLEANEMSLDEAIDMGPIAETDSVLWQRVCQACIDSYLDLENEFDWWWRAPVEWQGEPLDEGDDGYVFAAPAAEEDPVAPAPALAALRAAPATTPPTLAELADFFAPAPALAEDDDDPMAPE